MDDYMGDDYMELILKYENDGLIEKEKNKTSAVEEIEKADNDEQLEECQASDIEQPNILKNNEIFEEEKQGFVEEYFEETNENYKSKISEEDWDDLRKKGFSEEQIEALKELDKVADKGEDYDDWDSRKTKKNDSELLVETAENIDKDADEMAKNEDENKNENDGKFEINMANTVAEIEETEQQVNAENVDENTEIKMVEIDANDICSSGEIADKNYSEPLETNEINRADEIVQFEETGQIVDEKNVDKKTQEINGGNIDIKTQDANIEFDKKTQEKNGAIVKNIENNILKMEVKNEDIEDAELEEFFKFYEVIYDEIIEDIQGKSISVRLYYSNEIYDYYCQDCRDEAKKIIEKDLFFEKFDERFNVKK
ncbi:hypothetical protein KA977_06075 [Candidatus Dependentiae bacterium]|nr:hypothetical protein [Candidatus Dependentiae bacterium]